MNTNSKKYYIQKQLELCETLETLRNDLIAVQLKVDNVTSKIKPLERILEAITNEQYELRRFIQEENKTIEEYTQKLANILWETTKSELAAENEKSAMGVYFKVMEMHISNSPITNSTPLRVPCEDFLKNDNAKATKNTSHMHVTSAQIVELEEDRVRLNISRLEIQRKLAHAKEQNSILHKRNAAKLLRLRKSLLESESIRKSLIDSKIITK